MSLSQRKVLLVHTGPLSHILMALQAIETLHQGIPNLEAHILTTELGGSFFELYPPIKKIITIANPHNAAAIFKLMPQIKAEGYLCILFFHEGIVLNLMGRLCKIPIRIGPYGWPNRLLFTHSIMKQPFLHQSEMYVKFLDPFDIDLSPRDFQLHRYFQKHHPYNM